MNTANPIAVYTESSDTDLSHGITSLQEAGFDVRVLDTRDGDEIVAAAAEAEVLLVGYANVTREMMQKLPQLQLVALMSMGTDNVDLAAADDHGIWVTNVPGAATEEVATHALALILHLVRQLSFYAANAIPNAEAWNSRAPVAPWRLSEQTLGILGLGKIGGKLAELAMPLFGRIVGYDPLLPDTADSRTRLSERGIERVTLEEARKASNVLSLHMPLTPETESLIDEAFIQQMPQRALIVNVSRGSLIDSAAVAAAIRSGRLAGAGLDVLDTEPPVEGSPLIGLEGVVVTPHVAYFSERTGAEYVRIQAQNAVTLRDSGKPVSPVNRLNSPWQGFSTRYQDSKVEHGDRINS